MVQDKNTAILLIRNAGIGDILAQVNNFLLACDRLKLQPSISYNNNGQEKNRNIIDGYNLYDLLGFSTSPKCNPLINSAASSEPTYSFKEFYYMAISDGETDFEGKDQITVKYGLNGCYGCNFKRHYNSVETHPVLMCILINSPLAVMIAKEKEKKKRPQIFFHLRRGDISQIELSYVENLLLDKSMTAKIAHVEGIFTKEEAALALPLGHKRHYSTTATALKVLKQHIAETNPTPTVIFASDGFSQLAGRLTNRHSELFLSGTSMEALEIALCKEIAPLVQLSDLQFIGESGDLLVQTLVQALASDKIISSRPGMFRRLANVFCNENTLSVYVDRSYRHFEKNR